MEVECIIIDNETCDGDDNNITLEGEPNILPNSGEFCKIADKEVAKTNTAIKSVLLDPQYNQPDSTVTVQDTDAKEDDHPTNSNNATNLTNASNSISSIDDIASTLLCPVGCGAWLAECHMSRHVDQHFAQNTAVQQRDAKRGTPGSPTLLASKRPRMNGVGRKAVTKKQTKRTSWGALGSAKADLSVKDTSRGPRRTYPEVMMKSRKIGVHTLDSGKNNGINHGVNNGTDNGTVTFKHSEGAAISIGQVRNTGGNSNQHAENNNANSSSSKHRIDLNKHGIHHNTAAMSNLDNHTGQLRIGECDRVHSGRDVKTHAYNGNQPNRIHANGNNNGDKNRHHANNDTNSKTYIRNQNMTQNVSNAHPRTSATIQNTKPLAERMRPKDLDGFVGQLKSIGPSSALRVLLEKDRLPSLILWGGPGSGKTTLAKIISRMTAMHFAELSAVSSGISDIKRILSEAEGRRKLLNKPTILFIDEIHRFNKVQQDALLPHVEAPRMSYNQVVDNIYYRM
ncbi:hypothetical protein SARC_05154 [Sphaeroforma arctica JP610]|uniref:AAA+ ATPase domain-containing protein n=1 Tax=Sphaeroforma arctica JP610 TaxID=667725 RepID=A0A0L0G2Z0_9EUKA|nr:hypothetical protein SARC_05154 [Sphaeroforma arctica JP610]KNC82558.1 hypothetical protein SARC_05154 [Sphaeroforma arctica JP610]|eukprot:XP_014156460.1 hypothetical protein SARC_05154 [Sphaeroforma arctica JP610]